MVLSMGDRIMRELSLLSRRMVRRKRIVYKVVSQLLPNALLTTLIEQESKVVD